MEVYDNQVGGHAGTLYLREGRIIKPTNQQEVDFYIEAQNESHALLHPFLAKFYKSVTLDLPDKPNVKLLNED